jgi:hypothetical protein
MPQEGSPDGTQSPPPRTGVLRHPGCPRRVAAALRWQAAKVSGSMTSGWASGTTIQSSRALRATRLPLRARP